MLARLGHALFIVAVGAVLISGCADRAHEPAPVVEITAMRNGAIKLEGMEYRDVDALRTKLVELERGTAPPHFRLELQDKTNIDNWIPAVSLLQKTGVLPVGFTLYAPNSTQRGEPIDVPVMLRRTDSAAQATCMQDGQAADRSIIVHCDPDCEHQTGLVEGTPRYALLHKLCDPRDLPKQ